MSTEYKFINKRFFAISAALALVATALIGIEPARAANVTVTFDANPAAGTQGTMAPQVLVNGEGQLSKNQFSRPGYEVIGWATTPGGSVVYSDEAVIPTNAPLTVNTTLYAKWGPVFQPLNHVGPVGFVRATYTSSNVTLEISTSKNGPYLPVSSSYLSTFSNTPAEESFPFPARVGQFIEVELVGTTTATKATYFSTNTAVFTAVNNDPTLIGELTIPGTYNWTVPVPAASDATEVRGSIRVRVDGAPTPWHPTEWLLGLVRPPYRDAPAPTNVQSEVVGLNTVKVSWTPTTGVEYEVVASPGGPVCTGTLPDERICSGFTPGVEYTFTVTARRPNERDPATAAATLTLSQADITPPPYTGPLLSGAPAGGVRAVAGGTFSVAGERLSTVTRVTIGGLEAEMISTSDGLMTLQAPAGLAAGSYDIVMTSSSGRVTVMNAIVITGTSGAIQGGDRFRVWTRDQFDGTIKFYTRDVIGVGKIQFKVNGREVAWIRAADANDSKLNLGPAGDVRDGMVRSVPVIPGKNALEIYLDGKRIWRAAYTGR